VWKLVCEFSTSDCPPSPLRNPPTQSFRKNSDETTAPSRGAAWSDLPIRRPSKALRWAMFRLRREIASWALPPPRRENLVRGLGQALWRALKRGLVRTTAQLRRLLHEILGHLRDAPAGVSASLKRACGYAGAITLMGLRTIGVLPERSWDECPPRSLWPGGGQKSSSSPGKARGHLNLPPGQKRGGDALDTKRAEQQVIKEEISDELRSSWGEGARRDGEVIAHEATPDTGLYPS